MGDQERKLLGPSEIRFVISQLLKQFRKETGLTLHKEFIYEAATTMLHEKASMWIRERFKGLEIEELSIVIDQTEKYVNTESQSSKQQAESASEEPEVH
jgi:hypothetical protein